ncbi:MULTISPECIES: sigma-70 family RNA polymerase sigma factor [Brevibacillus]|uniref:Sigma-70 family RNA polymerase sigma factor n=1 Tax=Brevibacillus invocatus TaxID=173959 RepID=A0A3M8CMI1_9BACL|nr:MULTISPECIES: sigma-70 family RNA polymerase sigma factor [Brevibacillus]MCM3079173.1 sigma-70 family RNA polymerase sigma factor [Brevibacillus invocatus]MCM3429284.1 sigma-70 family RNA polymerase sigma factor [Brevibacillus invocatus]MDH4615663.1 sigma-70 family RNA polymerase sigma factor [Brevibacillus sp. AY1]RNB76833.1 sigma-70 family RNA polymerase sigma factor [Brevibacillus invocatus]
MDTKSVDQMGRFRKKVIQLAIVEKKSIYETAIACGCTAEKVKRVIKKWKTLSRYEESAAPAHLNDKHT